MSGRKQFDEETSLDRAMLVFWQKGYEATSLADLEAAMGLSKSSIYNAYHSKEALYTRCLDRFGGQHGQAMLAELAAPDFHAALARFFDRLLDRLDADDLPPGCLATMAALEVGGTGTAPACKVVEGLDTMRGVFEQRCRKAVRDGQLPPGTDCAGMAAAILATTRGIAVLNRGYGDTAVARAAVRHLLDSLAR